MKITKLLLAGLFLSLITLVSNTKQVQIDKIATSTNETLDAHDEGEVLHNHSHNTKEIFRKNVSTGKDSRFCTIAPSPDPTTVDQPNNTSLTIYIKGSAVAHYLETTDGYTVLKANDGYYKYAKQTSSGNLLPSNIIANNVGSRTQQELTYLSTTSAHLRYTGSVLQSKMNAYQALKNANNNSNGPNPVFPSTGTQKALLILIDYPDQLNTYPKGDFTNMTNQSGYSVNGQNGSFKDFYLDISNNQLTINTTVDGWYTAANNRSTYGNANGSTAARNLVREAVDAAEAGGVDFSQYDGDGDGNVDVVMIIHSGRGMEESGNSADIWSHRWVLAGQAVTYDGVTINDYIIQPETYSSSNIIANIGVLCHEFGHALGLPDLYDTDGSSEGIGDWCLMAGGTWNNGGRTPAHMSAWCKNELGWINPTVLSGSGTVTNMDYVGNTQEFYRFNTSLTNEYFLLENRQKQGWDAFLDGEGLAIWHIDDNQTNNANENQKWVDLEAADGDNDMDNNTNQGDAGDLYPGSSNNTSFTGTTNPNSNLYSGASTGISITNISENGLTVSFGYGGGVAPPPFCSNVVNTFPYTEGFENTIGGWTQATTDDFDWTNQSGSTGSTGTGPTSSDEGAYYLYTEASNNFNNKAELESPCFVLSQITNGNYQFRFSYHMYGASMGTLDLEAKTSSGTWTNLWSKTGDQGNAWIIDSVNLANYANDTLKLRFVGTTGTSYTSDIAIDGISLGYIPIIQAQPGESCATAWQIAGTGTFTTDGPSSGNGCHNCGTSTHADWWYFTAPADGYIDIASCGYGQDTRLFMYDGTCTSLNQVAFNDDDCIMSIGSNPYASQLIGIPVTANTTYYFEWDDRWTPNGFSFDFDFYNCVNPNTLTATNITSNSADLGWVAGLGTSWNIEWGVAGFTQGNGTVTNVTTNPYTLTGLVGSTTYEFYVQEDCGNTQSGWSGPISFTTTTTPCGSVVGTTLPFIEDFETYFGSFLGNQNLVCDPTYRWDFETDNQTNGQVSIGTSANSANASNGAVTLDAFTDNVAYQTNDLILTLDLNSYTSSTFLELSFDFLDHGDEAHPEDRVYVRGSDVDAWIEIYDWSTTNSTVYISVTGLDIDAALTANGQIPTGTFQVKFSQYDNYGAPTDGVSFDNIKIEENSGTCPMPTAINETNITATGAILNWTGAAGAVDYTVQWRENGTASWNNATTTNTSFSLSGLTTSTTYQWQVSTNCAAATSLWTTVSSFTTLQGTNNPFTWTATNQSGVFLGQAEVAGVPTEAADWIGAFDPNGNCAGAAPIVFNNGIGYINLPIYGDDATTTGTDEGITGSESFTLKLYDASANVYRDYPTSASKYQFTQWANTNGAPMPAYNDANAVYNFLDVVADTIVLKAGWNLVSTDVLPIDSTIVTVFADLIANNNLIYVTSFDNGSVFHDPNGLAFLNTLHEITRGFGYWVKVTADDTLIVQGLPLPSTFKSDLNANWNLTAYVPQTTADPAVFYSNLITANNLVYVTGFDNGSKFYDPNGLPFLNSLTTVENSFGYWVKVNTAVGGASYSPTNGITPTNIYNFLNGSSNLSAFAGEEVIIELKDGTTVGYLEILQGGYLMTTAVYGDDPTTAAIDGMVAGDKLLFRFRDEVLDVGIEFAGDMNLIELDLNFTTTSTLEPMELTQLACYPNPFSTTVNIEYQLKEQHHLSVRVFTLQGKEVATLVNNQQSAGQHLLQWDGDNVPNGIYLVTFEVEGQVIETQKLLLQR